MTTIEFYSSQTFGLRHKGCPPNYIVVDDLDGGELVHNPMCIEDLNFVNEFKRAEEIGQKLSNEIRKSINDLFEKTVRENSYPPIKGEITKGKLKWRGIKLCQKRTTLDRMEQWIEQRGIIIGKPVVIDFSILHNGKSV